jgi:hypothetical protein
VVLVVMLLLLMIYILGGVRIDENLMTNLYIYKVVCNPFVDQPADLQANIACSPYLSRLFVWNLNLRVSYMSHQKRESCPVCKKWKNFMGAIGSQRLFFGSLEACAGGPVSRRVMQKLT